MAPQQPNNNSIGESIQQIEFGDLTHKKMIHTYFIQDQKWTETSESALAGIGS